MVSAVKSASGLWVAFPWKISWEIKHVATALQKVREPEGLCQPRGKRGKRDLTHILYLCFLKPLYS